MDYSAPTLPARGHSLDCCRWTVSDLAGLGCRGCLCRRIRVLPIMEAQEEVKCADTDPGLSKVADSGRPAAAGVALGMGHYGRSRRTSGSKERM